MKKAYSLKPFYKITYSLYAVMAVILVFLKFQGIFFTFGWVWNIVVIVFVITGIVYLYNIFFEKLIVSESGIEHQAFLQHFFLTWNQVEEIPARLSFKVLIGKSSRGKQKRIISLYLFADNPMNSELGQQIKQCAPHLFEKENNQST